MRRKKKLTVASALVAAACEAMICLCMMFGGCLHPTPPPVPGPTPASPDAASPDVASADAPLLDPFKNQDFDCHLPIVASQYTSASQSVARCLNSPPLTCLAGLIPAYDVNTVACVARDLGFEANNTVLAGTDAGSSSAVADNVRNFINAECLGFK